MAERATGFSTIAAYIASFPPETQRLLESLRAAIRAAAPDATERISYQMPTFFQNGNLVHFAARKNGIGFYPTSGGIEAFKDEVSRYIQTPGALRFPSTEPLPIDLITRIVRFRVAENLGRTSRRRTP